MSDTLIYAIGVVSGVPLGFIIAAWVFRSERVVPDDKVHGDVPHVGER